MRVLGVIDLLDGRAVHARGGRRSDYAAIVSVAGTTIAAGDPEALARQYVERLGIQELYLADLDAIQGGRMQEAALSAVSRVGAPLWVDAGVTTIAAGQRTRDAGAGRVIVGLETLGSFSVLDEICAALGGAHVAFSLDLRNGQPIHATGLADGGSGPDEMASRAAAAGVGAIIVLDLARVGAGAGLDVPLVARVRRAAPGVVLLAGGGVRGQGDLDLLERAGCDGALVATALLEGRLPRATSETRRT